MSSPYDRYDPGRRRPRASWSHWVPLVLTVTVATVGVAAWVWNQRSGRDEDGDEDGDEDPDLDHNTDHVYADLDYENADYGDNPAYGATTRPSAPAEQSGGGGGGGGGGWGSHMSGALLRRTPSPQQLFDSARKTVAAGVTAAGAAVGSALAIIREEDKGAYADHETWSEEADAKKSEGIGDTGDRRRQQQRSTRKKRRVVAVVVSAENSADDLVGDGFHEHASILSHIPHQNDFSTLKLFILIHAPGLKDSSPGSSTNLPPASLSSSFSNIEHNQAQSQDGGKSPRMDASASDPAFNAMYAQALSLVEKESNVLPFTTANGYIYILRHLNPDVIYLQESLAGDNGALVTQMQSWLRHDLVLVVGAGGGHGGLADSESEAEKPDKPDKPELWWLREDRVGRGRGVVVVDGMRVHDDWARRVQNKE